jgi:hypothetical protein
VCEVGKIELKLFSKKLDFLKERIGIEVGFTHSSFIGIDLLKFQVASYSSLDKIDVGVYIVTTRNFQKRMKMQFNQNWEGSLTLRRVQFRCQFMLLGLIYKK